MQNDQSRAITAVLISGVILFVWQYFYAPPKKTNNIFSPISNENNIDEINNLNTTKDINPAPIAASTNLPKGQSKTLLKGKTSYTLNDSLMVTESLYEGTSAAKEIFETKIILSIIAMEGLTPKKSGYNLIKISEESFEAINSNLGITIKGSIQESGKLALAVNKNSDSKITSLMLKFQSLPGEEGSYQTRNFAYAGNDLETIKVGDEKKETGTINWVGMDFLYHIFAVSLNEKTAVNLTTSAIDSSLTTYLNIKESKLDFNIIFIKKNYDLLKKIGKNLHLSVDFGIFSIIAIPILRGLQFFYSIALNYGIAIIFLTIVIRVLTFPLQYKSTKSMKKMQIIQPELKKIQEKYKENPQKLQKESMELFKKAGANPLSGCLPLLLQMPIFFAFYKVLYNAVELVHAPFYFWIHDLSQKDPYYVLPVLMTAAMFLQQQLTPTATADPAQKKVMMIMPIVFGFIMKDLPSGLNLYILISTVMAILMQLVVLKKIKA